VTTYMNFDEAIRQIVLGMPPAEDAGLLGVSLDPADSRLVIIPVHWEATTSYGGGTSQGPDVIVPASHQLDVGDAAFGEPFRVGIAMVPEDPMIRSLSEEAKKAAKVVIQACMSGGEATAEQAFVNESSRKVNDSVYKTAKDWLSKDKFVAVLGGDHSSPQGLIKALSEKNLDGFGILQFDAHQDFRDGYEGFTHSHASIFFNVMTSYPEVSKITQVGIRDYSIDERRFMESLGDRASCFYSRDIFREKAEGRTFKEITSKIIDTLPEKVYVSFDIDALDPSYCPSTGTPVPGGLSFDEACYILEALASSGRKVIGFDLNEVSPSGKGDEWDANVGARILYKLCGCLLRSQKLC
jgi:agmatinase